LIVHSISHAKNGAYPLRLESLFLPPYFSDLPFTFGVRVGFF